MMNVRSNWKLNSHLRYHVSLSHYRCKLTRCITLHEIPNISWMPVIIFVWLFRVCYMVHIHCISTPWRGGVWIQHLRDCSPQSLAFICSTWRNNLFQFVTLRQRHARRSWPLDSEAKYVLNLGSAFVPSTSHCLSLWTIISAFL